MHPYDPQSVSLGLGSKRWWCVEDSSFQITSTDAFLFNSRYAGWICHIMAFFLVELYQGRF